MSSAKNSQADATPKSNTPLRVALFVLLGVLVIVLGLDQYARRQVIASADKIESLLSAEEEESTVSVVFEPVPPSRVKEALGREPVESLTGPQRHPIERYTWRSPIREYSLYVVYSRGSSPNVQKISPYEEPEELTAAPVSQPEITEVEDSTIPETPEQSEAQAPSAESSSVEDAPSASESEATSVGVETAP